jgi:hypothetical protein
MAAPAPTSRSREAPQGDEEAAAELKLGEFQDVDALTHSEAALVINALVAKRRSEKKHVNETEYVVPLSIWFFWFGLEGEGDNRGGDEGREGAGGGADELEGRGGEGRCCQEHRLGWVLEGLQAHG